MASSEPMVISCDLHGRQASAIICTHMGKGQLALAGFIENTDDPHNLRAWCQQCDDKFMEKGGMTEALKAFNDMRTICVTCHLKARQRHILPDS